MINMHFDVVSDFMIPPILIELYLFPRFPCVTCPAPATLCLLWQRDLNANRAAHFPFALTRGFVIQIMSSQYGHFVYFLHQPQLATR